MRDVAGVWEREGMTDESNPTDFVREAFLDAFEVISAAGDRELLRLTDDDRAFADVVLDEVRSRAAADPAYLEVLLYTLGVAAHQAVDLYASMGTADDDRPRDVRTGAAFNQVRDLIGRHMRVEPPY